jgi:xanthine/CO dehydrogenase XdhC/CoxF family maturation factor
MSDLDQVLRLWRQIEATQEDCVVATIVRVEGSSYRKPGARMLITKSGLRAGTISGGCLEAEVSRQGWWLTQDGPTVKQFSTSFEADSDRPYGLGCGGTIHLLLERRATAEVFLRELSRAFSTRRSLACAVVVQGPAIGSRCLFGGQATQLAVAAEEAWRNRESFQASDQIWAEYLPPRCGLFVFGAGDDAKPLVAQASTLGWHITVADGRAHLATGARFPQADEVVVLRTGDITGMTLLESDAAVVMTHSYEQDSNILQGLLSRSLAYLGVLGPRYRTADLLEEAALALGGNARQWMKKVHAPVGLDIGGDSPATIALAILAEIQNTVSQRTRQATGVSLRASKPHPLLS